MPVYRLDERLIFPPAHLAERSGLLAVGGDLSPERLLLAYASGIFPWSEDGVPTRWYSPDPRYVLRAENLHVSRSLAKRLRRATYEVRLDERFADVIVACRRKERPGQWGTWITREVLAACVRLHELGFAHSAEAYLDGRLVGGVYGLSLGSVFFAESMYTDAPDASKVALVTLVRQLAAWGIDLVDCQIHSEHVERFGAEFWSRDRYLRVLRRRIEVPNRRGPWTLDLDAEASSP